MPAPSAVYFDDGLTDLSRNDLGADANVQIRIAIRRINQFIEGGDGAGLKESLHGVAVDASIADLMNAPGDFDGSTVRTGDASRLSHASETSICCSPIRSRC